MDSGSTWSIYLSLERKNGEDAKVHKYDYYSNGIQRNEYTAGAKPACNTVCASHLLN